LKILILATDFFSKGGIQRYTRYQYKALVDIYGSENIFVFSLAPKQFENIFEENIEIEYIGNGSSIKSKIDYTLKALSFLKKNNIDIVISTHVQLSIIGYLAKKLFSINYYTNVYGLEIWSGLKYRDKIGLLNSDKLIGDCNFILQYIKKEFIYDSSKFHLLYDPVDMSIFKPSEKNIKILGKYNIPHDKFILSTIGRLERNKGHKLIIESLTKLDKNIIYVIVGGGFMRDELEKLVMKLNLKDRVVFTGRVPEEELVDFYNIADVIVLLSIFGDNEGEGLPLGLIEASACAKPIIAGNQDGSLESISKHKPNGFAINPTSLDELVERINILYGDKTMLKEHGNNGLLYVKKEFSFDNFKINFKKILEDE
jgi:glycosyltransferase involved in cell wall biosynthesis